MNVAMIETGGWGGIGHYAWNLCRALAAEGARVTLLTASRYELDDLDGGFAIERCFDGRARYPRLALRLLRRLRALNADVVHVQSLLSTRWDALLWPLARRRAPLVATAHNVRMHEPGRWEEWTLWRVLDGADAVVVHTREGADVVKQRLGDGHRVELIHHGDYAFFAGRPLDRAAARLRLDLPADGPLLLVFGAIRPYKGVADAVTALRALRGRHPGARLVVVGPLLVGTEAEYRALIAGAGMADAVVFRPRYVPHAEVAAYFAAADVAVFAYREVTDSGSLRIAASLGTPIVATTVGAFREFLTDGVSGRLVPPGEPAALAAAVADLLGDRAAAERMAGAARALAASAWSWADSARATLALYRSLAPRAAAGLEGARRG